MILEALRAYPFTVAPKVSILRMEFVMKKYFVNDSWELEELEDTSDLFLLVVERSLPDCSYIHRCDVSPEALVSDYNNLISQYSETGLDGPMNICIIKVPNTEQITNQISCADSEHKGTTQEAIDAINNVLNRADCEFVESWHKEPLTEKKRRRKSYKPFNSITYSTGYPELDIGFFNDRMGTGDLDTSSGLDNSGCSLIEADTNEPKPKRYIKRYYIRPQNIFCSKKSDILQALVKDVGDANCSVYSLKSLADHDDVHLLKPSDIIYYYDDGILYDKNHVKVMDYDLNVKHEEERKKFADVDSIPDHVFDGEYEDRLTEELHEDVDTCVICGEPYEGHGNNPAPVAEKGKCCNACNMKFVIPARLEASKRYYEDN